jgi:hypothetical protein
VVIRSGKQVVVQHVDLRGVWRVLLCESSHLHVQALHPLRYGLVLRHQRGVRIIGPGSRELQRVQLLPHTSQHAPEAADLGTMQGLLRLQRVGVTAVRGVEGLLYAVTTPVLGHVRIQARKQVVDVAALPGLCGLQPIEIAASACCAPP